MQDRLSKILPAPDAAIAKAGELIAQSQAADRRARLVGHADRRTRRCCGGWSSGTTLPFATTTMAKGLIDEDHPLSLGVIERACRQIQRKLLRSADLIVGLGLRHG